MMIDQGDMVRLRPRAYPSLHGQSDESLRDVYKDGEVYLVELADRSDYTLLVDGWWVDEACWEVVPESLDQMVRPGLLYLLTLDAIAEYVGTNVPRPEGVQGMARFVADKLEPYVEVRG